MNRNFVTLKLLTLFMVVGLGYAQNEPTIYIYNNSGTLQFDAGGSSPDVLGRVQDYIAEQSGVRPEVIIPPGSGPESDEKLNLLLGSRDPLDVFQGDWTQYQSAIIPLNDLLDEYGQNLRDAIPAEQWLQMTDAEGNIMGIPRFTPTSPYITWVRQDWLDELGLEVPGTLEELEATITAFKEHNPESFIATRADDLTWSTLGGFTPNGMSNWLDPEDNRVKPWIMQPGVETWLAKMRAWWDAGYFYADTFTPYDEPEVFRTCNLGVWLGWYSRITLITPQIESACEGIEWTRTSIVGPEGFLATVAPQGSSGYLITRKAEDPAAVIRFMNWVYDTNSVENQLTARYGIPEEMWHFVDEENNVIEPNPDSGYLSEYILPNLNIEVGYKVEDPERAMHLDYLANELLNFSDAKMPFDADIAYDAGRLADEVPTLGDLERLIDESLIGFITGTRPLEDWTNFRADLEYAGMESWIDALTVQYQELAE